MTIHGAFNYCSMYMGALWDERLEVVVIRPHMPVNK